MRTAPWRSRLDPLTVAIYNGTAGCRVGDGGTEVDRRTGTPSRSLNKLSDRQNGIVCGCFTGDPICRGLAQDLAASLDEVGAPYWSPRRCLAEEKSTRGRSPGVDGLGIAMTRDDAPAAAFDLTVFFINLDRHPDRQRFIEAQLAAAGIKAERFAGVDGSDNVPAHLAGFFPPDSSLTSSQIGCSASRFEIMRTILERRINAALVLEDDARLPSHLGVILNDVLAVLPDGWDLVRLCRAPKRAFRPLHALSESYRLVRYSRIPVGAAAYLVSQSGARKLLTPRRCYRPGDVEIAHPWLLDLDVYGVVPPPVSQERSELPSTIGKKRGDIGRSMRALPDARRMIFNMRKLGASWWFRCWAANVLRRTRLAH
jgi:glycosyl transferase family 25